MKNKNDDDLSIPHVEIKQQKPNKSSNIEKIKKSGLEEEKKEEIFLKSLDGKYKITLSKFQEMRLEKGCNYFESSFLFKFCYLARNILKYQKNYDHEKGKEKRTEDMMSYYQQIYHFMYGEDIDYFVKVIPYKEALKVLKEFVIENFKSIVEFYIENFDENDKPIKKKIDWQKPLEIVNSWDEEGNIASPLKIENFWNNKKFKNSKKKDLLIQMVSIYQLVLLESEEAFKGKSFNKLQEMAMKYTKKDGAKNLNALDIIADGMQAADEIDKDDVIRMAEKIVDNEKYASMLEHAKDFVSYDSIEDENLLNKLKNPKETINMIKNQMEEEKKKNLMREKINKKKAKEIETYSGISKQDDSDDEN